MPAWMAADLQQREVQKQAAQGAGELDAPTHLGGVLPQPPDRASDRTSGGACQREKPAKVHAHRLHHLPHLPRFRRGPAQELPPIQEATAG